MALSTQLLAGWRGAIIHQPSLYIAGARDDVLKFASARSQIEHFPTTLTGLRGCHILDGAGHWIQREHAAAFNELLIAFLGGFGRRGGIGAPMAVRPCVVLRLRPYFGACTSLHNSKATPVRRPR